ncbi:MAG: hypothetical protein LQ349_004049 [Xanthoria aureola]|nr:MAG: hypothetical protein LQ349_004049 [Xanthoria aureola]
MGVSTSFRKWWHSPPAYLRLRSSKWTIGITAFGACFTDGYLYGSIVPVLPFSLVERSGVSEDDVQFWLSMLLMVFGLFLGGGAPIAGWAADRGPRSTPFMFGLVLAFAATLLFCFASKPWVLILGRILQGLSASVIYTAGLALVADAVDPKEIGAWMGFVFSGNTLGLLFSPFLAGIVYDYLGYYAVFIILFGVIAVDIVLRGFMIEKRTADKWLAMENKTYDDIPDQDTREPDVSSERDPLGAGNDDGTQQSPPADERSSLLHSKPKQSRSWLGRLFPTIAVLASSPRLMVAVYGCFTHTMLLASIDSILPLFVKRTFEWTSTGAGVIFLTITCPSLFGGFFGALSDRYGSRPVCLTGLATTTLNLALMGLVAHNALLDKILLCIFLLFVGVGLNLIFPSLAADLFYEVDVLAETHSETFGTGGAYAQAYSLLCLALGAGTSFGPIWAGLFYQMTNWPITMATLAGLTALPAVGVFFYTGGGANKEKQGGVEASESRV